MIHFYDKSVTILSAGGSFRLNYSLFNEIKDIIMFKRFSFITNKLHFYILGPYCLFFIEILNDNVRSFKYL